jgi:hypothetical protein
VTAALGADGEEVPAELVAVTVKVTGEPSLSPGTIAQSLGASAVIVWPVDAVTVNEVTGAPSTAAGACQRTVAAEEPGIAVTAVGVAVTGTVSAVLPVTVAVGVTAFREAASAGTTSPAAPYSAPSTHSDEMTWIRGRRIIDSFLRVTCSWVPAAGAAQP